MSYEDVLWKVYDSFGASGFRKFRSIKEKALHKKYSTIQWKYIADFFKLPKIILSLTACIVMYVVFQKINGNYRIVLSIVAPIVIGSLIYYQLYLKKRFSIEAPIDKNFAILEHFEHLKSRFIHYAIFVPMNIFIWGHLMLHNLEFSSSELFIRDSLSALFFVFWLLLMYVFGYFLPKRIVADFQNEFPQFCID